MLIKQDLEKTQGLSYPSWSSHGSVIRSTKVGKTDSIDLVAFTLLLKTVNGQIKIIMNNLYTTFIMQILVQNGSSEAVTGWPDCINIPLLLYH